MGNDETRGAGRAARGGTETITRPDRMPRPRRERPAPPRPRPPADRAGAPGAADGTAPARTRPERPAGQEPRRRVPPQGFARPRGPVPDGRAERTRTAAPPAAPRVPRARTPATSRVTAPRPAPASQAPAAPKAQRSSPARTTSRMPFLLLVCGLLSGALVSALVISTTLAQGSFQISQLQQQDSVLARQRQALEAQVAQARSPTVIEQRAYRLGMRPVGVVRFLDLRDGKVKTDARGGAANGTQVRGSNR
jgi:cell division protein FtsB